MLKSYLQRMYAEGGNVFKGTSRATDKILKENIEPTIQEYAKNFKKAFPNVKLDFSNVAQVSRLGSVGKKEISGDIDLGVDTKNFLKPDGTPNFELLGISEEEFKSLFDNFKKRSRTATDKLLADRSMMVLMSKKINDSQDEIVASDKDVLSGAIFSSFPQYDVNHKAIPNKFVQVDLNIGPLEWLNFSYFSSGNFTGNTKGLHRVQLIAAIFDVLGHNFRHAIGIIDKDQNVIASNPAQAIALLNKAGLAIKPEDINDFDKILDAVNKSKHKDAIYEAYLKGRLDNMRDSDVPEQMQDWWLANRDRVGLRGIWLPENSALFTKLPPEEVTKIKAEREAKDVEKLAKNKKKMGE